MKKFLFLLILSLLFFIPGDTFASEGVPVRNMYIYDTNWNVLGSCTSGNCTTVSNTTLTTAPVWIRVQFEYSFYTSNQYYVQWNFNYSTDVSYSLSTNTPYVAVNSRYQDLSDVSYFQSAENTGSFLRTKYMSFSSIFTSTGNSSNPSYLPYLQVQISNPQNLELIVENMSIEIKNLGEDTSDIIQNSTQDIINNQNQNQQQTNEKLDDIEDSITSEEAPDLDALEDSAGWLPPGPVDSILNLPLTFFNNLISNLSKTCQPVDIPLPYVNKNLTLPCISTLYAQIGATTFLNWVGLIVGTIILYNYFLNLYKWIDDTIQMKDNSVDDWGGV